MPLLVPGFQIETSAINIDQDVTYNAIRNGLFDIQQRGSSFSTITNGQYTYDGWAVGYDATSIVDYVDLSIDTDTPDISEAGYHIDNALKMDVTTAQASPSSTAYWRLYQPIEGHLWERLRGAACTLQFWARTDRSGGGVLSSNAQVFEGSTRSWSKPHTLTSNWQQFQMTFTSEESWTEGTTTGEGARIYFVLYAGSTYQETPEQWNTTGDFAADTQTNFLDSTSNNVWIADVRLVPGSLIAEGPYPRSHEQEIQLCERYYQTSYDHGVGAGTNTTSGLVQKTCSGNAIEQNQMPGTQFGVKMRTTPTVTIYSKGGTSGAVSTTSYADFTTGCSIDSPSEHGFRAIVKSSPFTAAQMLNFHYQATAEL